jgi:addiction module HigA family antidote
MPPAIHPGEILAEELEYLDMSAAELGRVLGVPTNRITQILNGDRRVTADTALRLARWLGTSAKVWIDLQSDYDLRIAELENGEAIRRVVVPRDAA